MEYILADNLSLSVQQKNWKNQPFGVDLNWHINIGHKSEKIQLGTEEAPKRSETSILNWLTKSEPILP